MKREGSVPRGLETLEAKRVDASGLKGTDPSFVIRVFGLADGLNNGELGREV